MCKTIESAIGILLLGILITNCTFECNRKGMVSIVNNTQYTLNVFLDGSKYMTVVKNYNAPVEMTPGSHVLKVNTFISPDTVTWGPKTVDVTQCMMDSWTITTN